VKDRRDQKDFNAEIQAHLAHEMDRLVAAGMSHADAQVAARKTFGNVTRSQERYYESRRWLWWEQITQDARYAVRSWRKRPGSTAIVILSLGLGIGANTAIFSIVNTLLLKDLPYRDANRLMYVTEYWPHEPVVPGPPSPDFANWRANSKLTEAIAAYGGGGALNLTGMGEPERIQGTMVTHELLSLILSKLALGRAFDRDEDRLGGTPAVILGYSLWQRRFAGSPEVIGKPIMLDGVGRTVVGVLPAGFRFPDNNFQEELLVPMALPTNPNWQDERNFRFLRVLVRAKPGVAPGALKQEFFHLLGSTSSQEPPQMITMRKDMEVRVTPLRDWLTGNVRPMVLVLAAVVAMVLLIACLNVASLQIAISISRTKEMAVRVAVGAGGARLVRQLLTENLLLSLFAGCLGLALAHGSLSGLRAFLPANLHLADLVNLDHRVLLFTVLLTAIAGIFTGHIPALAAARVHVHDMLKEGDDRTRGNRTEQRMHGVLVTAEVAAAIVLLVGSGLLIRTFIRLAMTNPGFDPEGVLTLKIAPSQRKYPQAESRVAFYRNLLEQARVIPGVQFAAIGGGLPLVGTLGLAGISFQDRPEPPLGGRPSLPLAFVSPDYFQALGIPLVRGRVFTDADHEHAPRVAIVNQAFAEEYFPGENPLGKRIEMGSREGRWHEIVGIVGNVKQQSRRPVDPFVVYGPLPESFEPETFLILKSSVPPKKLASAAAKAVQSLDPNEPIFDVAPMEDRLGDSLSGPRSSVILMNLFAGFALLLATVGIFGVTAYFVSRRKHEIGIRMALGATRADVLRMVLGRGMLMVGAGIVLGVVGALALARTLGSLIEGFRINDPATVGLVAVMFLLIAAMACLIPARWAARVDPAVVLRQG
jgi:putative ABC transport system permease protein